MWAANSLGCERARARFLSHVGEEKGKLLSMRRDECAPMTRGRCNASLNVLHRDYDRDVAVSRVVGDDAVEMPSSFDTPPPPTSQLPSFLPYFCSTEHARTAMVFMQKTCFCSRRSRLEVNCHCGSEIKSQMERARCAIVRLCVFCVGCCILTEFSLVI